MPWRVLPLDSQRLSTLQRPLATGWDRAIDDELLVQDIAAATEGRPEHRLPSVADLVDRLQRLEARHAELQHTREREAAAAQTRAELARAQERVRARRPCLATAAVSLLLGLGASLAFAWQARSAQAQAEA